MPSALSANQRERVVTAIGAGASHREAARHFFDMAAKPILEVKGRFPASDWAKMKAIRQQYPDRKIEIRFYDPQTKIAKNSTTTYADGSENNDILRSKT